MGVGGGISSRRNFFLLSNSLYEFFLAHRPNANVADHSGGPGRVARSRG